MSDQHGPSPLLLTEAQIASVNAYGLAKIRTKERSTMSDQLQKYPVRRPAFYVVTAPGTSRRGEPAEIIGVTIAREAGSPLASPVFEIRYCDGVQGMAPVNDHASYQITHQGLTVEQVKAKRRAFDAIRLIASEDRSNLATIFGLAPNKFVEEPAWTTDLGEGLKDAIGDWRPKTDAMQAQDDHKLRDEQEARSAAIFDEVMNLGPRPEPPKPIKFREFL